MQRAGSSLTYTELGLQYYIAGRFAALNGLVPVAGNLFHHAIEMVLKAGLLTILTEDQLKCQFGHNLTKLWDSFKDLTQSQALSAFGDVIQELDRWEDLRYFTP